MKKRPYTPPKLRGLSLDEVRELERRHGVELLGNRESASSDDDTLPKKVGSDGDEK